MLSIIDTNPNTQNADTHANIDTPTPREEQALLAYDEEFRADFPTSAYTKKREAEEREEAWILADDGLQSLLDENGQLPPDAFI